MEYLIEKIKEIKRLQDAIGESATTDEGRLLMVLSDTVLALTEGMAIFCADSDQSFINDDLVKQQNMCSDHKVYPCPNCNSMIQIDDSIIEGEGYIICPKCSNPIMIITNEF